ncbi:DNA adenine methylase [Rhizomicrobium palustre]|uniref:site-specific DNA-methyltransferase (adenine-specific) n=1 Tax=Rhizomicrobium palustre TaxID=189966 RepID=A0A846N2N4_9PROT|nr:DNA adenine methylase [Rhizomicrobium palustre]NIK90188.1 DNA adenine methylase [Rhizomicrobium palustre]
MSIAASPLRYPGGKACLLDVTATVLRLNKLERGHYAEPYAGGCGLALELLYGGHVADIHINDIDPSIWAFWHCVLNETDALVNAIEKTEVTIEEWRKQRCIHRAQNIADPLALGFSAFFLNRTNRSGVIKDAGVIGGLAQAGTYKIDCRFNRIELIRRIQRISKYKSRIHLTNLDAIKFLKRCEKKLPEDSLIFIDPPYYNKGASLYTNHYLKDDHAKVAESIISLKRNWIVTYDDAPEIRHLYRDRRQYSFDVAYSLHQKRLGTELLIASKGLKIPAEMRERQVNRPQSKAA